MEALIDQDEDQQQNKKGRHVSHVNVSCTSCQRRKIRCDGETPCSQCIARGEECLRERSSRYAYRRTLNKKSKTEQDFRGDAAAAFSAAAAAQMSMFPSVSPAMIGYQYPQQEQYLPAGVSTPRPIATTTTSATSTPLPPQFAPSPSAYFLAEQANRASLASAAAAAAAAATRVLQSRATSSVSSTPIPFYPNSTMISNGALTLQHFHQQQHQQQDEQNFQFIFTGSTLPNGNGLDSVSSVGGNRCKVTHVGVACALCKMRKIKCDHNSPCSQCIARGTECVRDRTSRYSVKRKLNKRKKGDGGDFSVAPLASSSCSSTTTTNHQQQSNDNEENEEEEEEENIDHFYFKDCGAAASGPTTTTAADLPNNTIRQPLIQIHHPAAATNNSNSAVCSTEHHECSDENDMIMLLLESPSEGCSSNTENGCSSSSASSSSPSNEKDDSNCGNIWDMFADDHSSTTFFVQNSNNNDDNKQRQQHSLVSQDISNVVYHQHTTSTASSETASSPSSSCDDHCNGVAAVASVSSSNSEENSNNNTNATATKRRNSGSYNTVACVRCKQRKTRCSGEMPCAQCLARDEVCEKRDSRYSVKRVLTKKKKVQDEVVVPAIAVRTISNNNNVDISSLPFSSSSVADDVVSSSYSLHEAIGKMVNDIHHRHESNDDLSEGNHHHQLSPPSSPFNSNSNDNHRHLSLSSPSSPGSHSDSDHGYHSGSSSGYDSTHLAQKQARLNADFVRSVPLILAARSTVVETMMAA